MTVFSNVWNSDFVVLLRRLLLVYIALFLCRLVFYIYNNDLIGGTSAWEVLKLAHGAFIFDSASVAYAFILFILLSLLPFRFREKKGYQKMLLWVFMVTMTIVIALNLTDVVYFHYTQIRLTAADVMFAENDNTVLMVSKFITDNWYLVLLWVILVAILRLLYRYTGKPTTPINNRWAYFWVNLALLFAAIICCVAMMRGGGLSRDIRPITLTNAMSYTDSPAKANLILSNPFSILRTTGNSKINYTKYFTDDELSRIYTPYHYPVSDLSSSPNLAGRNIMIFVLESFSADNSALLKPELYPDDEGYTPFLDSLMREGYYFTRAYANGRKSIEALPAILGSMPSFKKPFAVMPQGLGEGMQLPKILAGKGYKTMFFCGSPNGSMGFDAYASTSGIKSIYDKNTYDIRRPGNKDYDGFWGVWDEPFLDYAGEVLREVDQPFFGTLFTVTSHHPFKIPAGYETILPEGKTAIQQPVAYTDQSVRKFFEKYGGEEWFRNTVFVFCADHVSSQKYAPEAFVQPGKQHIIAFIYTPDGALQGCNEKVFSQSDIMPTLLGLLGYDEPYFAFGRDIFNEPERIPMSVGYDINFMMFTDSLTIFFNEKNIVSAYGANDLMQENDVTDPDDPQQQELQKFMEAVIQQYYSHLKSKIYLVPDR